MAFFFRLRDHVQGADNNPLLIFPEGTCVNNHYTVMFKKVYICVESSFVASIHKNNLHLASYIESKIISFIGSGNLGL